MSAPLTHLSAYNLLSPTLAWVEDRVDRLAQVKEDELPGKVQEIRVMLQGLNVRLGHLIGVEELFEAQLVDAKGVPVPGVVSRQNFGPTCPECGSAAVRTSCSLFNCDDCSAYGHDGVVEGHL